MKRIALAALILWMFGWLAPTSRACFCVTPKASQAFEKAKVVFVGEISEIIPPRTNPEKLSPFAQFQIPLLDMLHTIKFKVEKSLKGSARAEVSILASRNVVRCIPVNVSYTFRKGEKYLVYAEPLVDLYGEPIPNAENSLTVTGCGNRTAPLAEAAEDIKELEALLSASGRSFSRISSSEIALRPKSNNFWWINLILDFDCRATDTRS